MMPFGDGTGPGARGPLTGRRMGFCAGYDTPGFANPMNFRGRGLGFSRGRGRGYAHYLRARMQPGYGASPFPAAQPPFYPGSAADEKKTLAAQAKLLEENLVAIQKRLQALEEQQDK